MRASCSPMVEGMVFESQYDDVAVLAFGVAGLLLDAEQGDLDSALTHLSEELDRVGVADDEHLEHLARCAARALADVPRWLRSTAALCRLVRAGEHESGELIERLFALYWAWVVLPEAPMSGEAIEDARLLRRDLDASFGLELADASGDST